MNTPVRVPDAPAPVGPYSQAQIVPFPGGERLVFTAGQIPIDPRTGELVAGGIAEQTDQVIRNVAAVLAGAGLKLSDVVKTTVYLADLQDFQAMNQVYAKHFSAAAPARTTIGAAGLPRGARIEIDAVAAGRDL